jgi:metal iron transporter
MRALRGFEAFVALLVLGVVICFCFELSKIHASVSEVFHGYVPSSTLVKSQAYVSLAYLGNLGLPYAGYTKLVAFWEPQSCLTACIWVAA